MRTRRPRSGQRGFSLLEVLVAFAIMALALGVLYQSLGGSVRGISEAGLNTRAVLTAESLLALHDVIPPEGVGGEGTTEDGFAWRVFSEPYPLPAEAMTAWRLHQIGVEVRWMDRGQERLFRLVSIRPEVDAGQMPGGGLRPPNGGAR